MRAGEEMDGEVGSLAKKCSLREEMRGGGLLSKQFCLHGLLEEVY